MVGTFNGATGYAVAQQGNGWYTTHIFADVDHFRAWMKRTRPGRIVSPTGAHGRCIPGIDHRYNEEGTPTEVEEMDTNKSQAQPQQARTAIPAPAQSQEKTGEGKRLDFTARLVSSSEAQLEVLREIRSALGIISGKLDILLDRAEAQTAAAAANIGEPEDHFTPAQREEWENAGASYTDFDAEVIAVGMDDNGKPVYKVRGGKFSKFGVRVWPETLPMLGVEIATLKPGPNQFNQRVRAMLDDKGQAKKVVGLAK